MEFSSAILSTWLASRGWTLQGNQFSAALAQRPKATLETIEKVLQEAGFELKDIVSVDVYLADINEFGDINKVYKEFLPDPKTGAYYNSGRRPGESR